MQYCTKHPFSDNMAQTRYHRIEDCLSCRREASGAFPFRVDEGRYEARVHPYVLPLSSEFISPGNTIELVAVVPMSMFRPQWLFIPKHVGQYLHVLDIQQGRGSGSSLCLLLGGGPMHALCFRETLTEKNRIVLAWEIAHAHQTLRVRVKNTQAFEVEAMAYITGFTGT